MKFYIAAYVREKRRVNEIHRKLKRLGHEITVDWTKNDAPKLKSRDRLSESTKAIATRDMNGVLDCDIFILLSDPAHGRAKYVELGAAIASFIKKGRPLVYILGKKNNQSVFYYHPAVKRVTCLDEIIGEFAGCKPIDKTKFSK